MGRRQDGYLKKLGGEKGRSEVSAGARVGAPQIQLRPLQRESGGS